MILLTGSVCSLGGLLPGGSVPGGVCSLGGVCLLPGGVCSQGSLLQGVSAPRGCLLPGESAPGGVCSQGVSAPGGCLVENPPGTATAGGGTHPTGMHSCLVMPIDVMKTEIVRTLGLQVDREISFDMSCFCQKYCSRKRYFCVWRLAHWIPNWRFWFLFDFVFFMNYKNSKLGTSIV